MKFLKYLLMLAGFACIVIGANFIVSDYGTVQGASAIRSYPMISLLGLSLGGALLITGIGLWVWQYNRKAI
jgi:hypothetical protein